MCHHCCWLLCLQTSVSPGNSGVPAQGKAEAPTLWTKWPWASTPQWQLFWNHSSCWQPSLMAEYWLLNISGVIWPWLLFKNLLNCDISIYFHPLSSVCPSGGPERPSSRYTAWPNRRRKVLEHLAVHPHFVSTVCVVFLSSWTFLCPDSKSPLCFSRVKATKFPKWWDLLLCYHREQNLQRLKPPEYTRIHTL